MNALWGAGQMMFNKILVITDADIDLNDCKAMALLLSENVHPVDDIIFNRGPVDVLDHSSSRFALGSKIGIDATNKLPVESLQTKIPGVAFDRNHVAFTSLSCNFTLVQETIPVLIITIDKLKTNIHTLHRQLFESGAFAGVNWVVYVDPEAVAIRIQDIVWLVGNNIDPLRDCFYPSSANGQQLAPMAVDGTGKSLESDGFLRQWPNVVTMDDTTITEVDEMWEKLGLGNFIPSPSLHYKVLVKTDGAVARG
jgi:4-hydroxy-3-polyprenylbenzoate decarboxylase